MLEAVSSHPSCLIVSVPCDVKYPDTDLLWVTNFNRNFASTPASKFAIICTRLTLQLILFIWVANRLLNIHYACNFFTRSTHRRMIWKGFIQVYYYCGNRAQGTFQAILYSLKMFQQYLPLECHILIHSRKYLMYTQNVFRYDWKRFL